MSMKIEVAQYLMNIQAVCLNPKEPFTWSSGLKSPIYTDNRMIMSYPKERKIIENYLSKTIQSYFNSAQIIAGTATAGIPHAAFVAAELDLPMIYVRSNAKKHGKERTIEGHFEKGARIILIEDLVSTGRSALQAADQIQNAGGQVAGVVSIFNYQLECGRKAFEEAQIPLVSLTDYTSLLEVAIEDTTLEEDKASLKEWYKDPQAWSDTHR